MSRFIIVSKITAHVLAVLIVFVSVPYCLYTVGAQANTGIYSQLGWTLVSFQAGPFVSLLLVSLLPILVNKRVKGLSQKEIFNGLILFNGSSCLGLVFAAVKTTVSDYGLWQYDYYHDRHFSISVLESYFFSPAMGVFGLYVVTAAYLSFRVLMKHPRSIAPHRVWRSFLVLTPIAAYYLLIYLHTFISQPSFIG